MGIFSRNWSRPGPGVDKNAPQKNAFFTYFELLIAKIWGLVTQNFLFFLVTLPVIVYAYMIVYTYFITIAPDLFTTVDGELVVPPLASMFVSIAAFIPQWLLNALTVVSLILYGPFMMGFTYVLRNYVRREHAWTSDFFSRAFSNFRQGLFFGILDIVVVAIFYINWNYINFSDSTTFALILRGLSTALLIFYISVRNYAYQLAVTVNLSVRHILKNSIIFSVIGFGRNVLSIIISAVIVFLSLFFTTFLDLVMLPFLMFSLMRFTEIYITYPIVNKYIVQPALEIERENAPDEEDDYDDEYAARLHRVEMFELPPELGGPGAGLIGTEDEPDGNGREDEPDGDGREERK